MYDKPLDLKLFNNKTLGNVSTKLERLNFTPERQDNTENRRLLEECRMYWDSLADFRDRRARSRNYYRGKQWEDYVVDDDGNSVTESQYIKDQGKVPLKQNIIRQLVKNLIGQYRSNPSKSLVIARAQEDGSVSEMLTNALQAAGTINHINQLDARNWEEFAVSGAAWQKITFRPWPTRNIDDLYVENINSTRIFYNSDISDVRLFDLRLIGEIIDTTLEQILVNFARNKKDETIIREEYESSLSKSTIREDGLTADKVDDLDFYIPQDRDKCRLYEIWQLKAEGVIRVHDPYETTFEDYPNNRKILEEIARINGMRLEQGLSQGYKVEEIPFIESEERYETFWYVKFLTPSAHCLWEGKTPYAHGSHPYAGLLYPLLDGEVWGMVEDVIDQQRYINRLIIMMDFIIGATAKGVLLVPENVIPKGMDISDFAKEWSRANGVIKYIPQDHMQIPQQIAANSVNVGIQEMIAFQMQFIQEVSGVQNAIQGKEAKSGTPSSLYAQEAQNATLNSVDYMESFNFFKQTRDMKALKTIVQFYRTQRYLAIAGNIYKDEAAVYDPSKVKDLDYDVVVTRGQDTPVFRSLVEETLKGLLEAQAIDAELYLENSTMPFAEKLLQQIRKKQEEIQQGAAAGQVNPELMQQAQGANPQALELFNKYIGQGAAV